MPENLIERLTRAPLVADGAMGTMLYGKGVYINKCYDEVTLSAPELVRDVHRAYVQAGSELIQTNTFGANAVKLATHGLEAQTEATTVSTTSTGVMVAKALPRAEYPPLAI